MVRNDSGQAWIEFMLSLTGLIITITATSWLLKIQWDRGRCAYLVFEHTHRHLLVGLSQKQGGPSILGSIGSIQFQDSPDQITGQGLCGESKESVTLPRLEPQSLPE